MRAVRKRSEWTTVPRFPLLSPIFLKAAARATCMDPMTKNLYFKIFKRNENICPQEDLYVNTQNRLKPEATQMSINGGTDKQIVE